MSISSKLPDVFVVLLKGPASMDTMEEKDSESSWLLRNERRKETCQKCPGETEERWSV